MLGTRWIRWIGVVVGAIVFLIGWFLMYSLEHDTIWSLPMVGLGALIIAASTTLHKNKLPPRWSKKMRDWGR